MESQHRLLDYHQRMLADVERVASFERALRGSVKPGDVVLDLGTGTGLLAMLACRAGAGRVYAMEQGEVGELARELFQANGMGDRIQLLSGRSDQLRIDEPADVVVAEILGNVGLDEGILAALIDARQRFLKRGGALIPRRVQVVMAPVELPTDHRTNVEFWRAGLHGLDYSLVRKVAAQQAYVVALSPQALRSEPRTVIDVHLESAETPFAHGSVSFEIPQECTIHGIGAWFRAELVEGAWLSNAPPNQVPSWNHRLFPFEIPSVRKAGDRMEVDLSTRNGSIWRWRAVVRRGAREPALEEHDHSTFAGFPLPSSTLLAQAGNHAPTRSVRGDAARRVLDALDGSHSIDQLASIVLGEAPDLFPTHMAAHAFVSTLVKSYGAAKGYRRAGG